MSRCDELNNLFAQAETANLHGQHAEAEQIYLSMLALCSQEPDYDPVEVVQILHHLALSLESQTRQEEAVVVRERAAGILGSLSRAGSYREQIRKDLRELSRMHAESQAALNKLADSFSNRSSSDEPG